MPEAYKQLREITTSLEKHYRDVQDFEFTIEEGKLYMLQTRNGKRTGPAAVRIAVDMVEEGLITKKEAVVRVASESARSAASPGARPGHAQGPQKIATGSAGLSGRRCRPRGVLVRRCGRTRDERPGDPGPQGNHSGRHSRHGRLQGHSDRGRRLNQPRRCRRARHGPPLRGGRFLHLS